MLFAHFRLAFQLCLFFPFLVASDGYGGNHKSTLCNGQIQKFGRLPAKLLQTVVCVVRLWVTVLYQFFASSTSSSSVLKPLTWKTSVM